MHLPDEIESMEVSSWGNGTVTLESYSSSVTRIAWQDIEERVSTWREEVFRETWFFRTYFEDYVSDISVWSSTYVTKGTMVASSDSGGVSAHKRKRNFERQD